MALRDVTAADLPIFFEHQREPEANQMAAFPPREWDVFMNHWRDKVLGNPTGIKKTILVGSEVAGNVVSWQAAAGRFVGYWVGRAFWGRGIATAALRIFVSEHETARPLQAYVATQNVGSIRVLEKCGFLRVGDPEMGDDGVEEVLFRLSRTK